MNASTPTIRDFASADADYVNRLVVAAFAQFSSHYNDWPALAAILAKTSELAASGEIMVAESGGRIAGAVAYLAPFAPKASFFEPSWPVIRTLVVDPNCRGLGLGRVLMLECLARARRDKTNIIALHTSPIMTVALPMYLRMGFSKIRNAPPVFGVEYAVYTKAL